MNVNSNEPSRGEGFPQILHDRARDSAVELHKTILSLSTGMVAVYFVALTTTTGPSLTALQQINVVIGIVVFSLSVFSGLVCSFADVRRNYCWANAIQAKNESSTRFYKLRDRWLKLKNFTWTLTLVLFSLGMAFSLAYMLLRLLKT